MDITTGEDGIVHISVTQEELYILKKSVERSCMSPALRIYKEHKQDVVERLHDMAFQLGQHRTGGEINLFTHYERNHGNWERNQLSTRLKKD